MRATLVATVSLLWAACSTAGSTGVHSASRALSRHQHQHKHNHKHKHRRGRNAAGNPTSPKVFARYVRALGRPGRSKWQKPAKLITALGIGPGVRIADIGAGTGYFTFRFARAVGKTGRVLAVDVDDRFLKLLKKERKRWGLEQVEVRKAPTDDPALPPGSVDVAFICNTYHHIHDRVSWLKKLRAALRPGGRVVNVDFVPGPLPVGPPPSHKLKRSEVTAEFAGAGYRLEREVTGLLPYQYVLVYVPK